MLSGFKKFVARGNVVDLAVGVVIGAAFGAVVNGLVESFINPLIAWLVGKPNFDALVFTLPPLLGEEPTVFEYGKIITAVVNFFLIALAIYSFVVTPMNKLTAKLKKEEEAAPQPEPEPEPSEEVLLLRDIKELLTIRKQMVQQNNLLRKE
ncbi:MAG: large conductance mechanosensitive channel protein MscL [Cardiobacteriaceae bacterium]|nr:large conductance mechanosensitive channel protein MscL [Cardiobacteriaceae bacterium]